MFLVSLTVTENKRLESILRKHVQVISDASESIIVNEAVLEITCCL